MKLSTRLGKRVNERISIRVVLLKAYQHAVCGILQVAVHQALLDVMIATRAVYSYYLNKPSETKQELDITM